MILPAKRNPLIARSERFVLREFERLDVDRWCAWPNHDDPLLSGYNPPPLTPRQRDEYFRHKETEPSIRQYAVSDHDDNLLGRISLREIDWRERTAVLGVTVHPDCLDKGLGTEAMHAFLRYYFVTLGMNALLLDVAAFNERARHLYTKLGFRQTRQRWGDPQPDFGGVFRDPKRAELRPLFQQDLHFVRPLVIDMCLSRADYLLQHLPTEAAGDVQPAAAPPPPS